ncbi:hypothetical protein Poly24_08950 [Rosistilla carotiformis]|uniref:Uncharacterized protein n=1 Tax=Rosistilla carotiformis TaxID=2528017 RepID=A0A518JNT7_9BACT|nr:hypothetical protein [Rosistilla carotiformis]QDV67203.1 hypothetical protein Poly24_08950 [Rosistilla carotiformis]
MRIITSLAPSRMDRQKECIDSWSRYGHAVAAVQSTLDVIDPIDGVDSLAVSPSQSKFAKPHLPYITDLIDQGPGLVLNSDISLTGPIDWDWRPGTLYCGIRHNGPELERWGIDAFFVPSDIRHKIPNVGFLVGMPGWDWWLPYHCHLLGVPIHVDKRPVFQHTPHPIRWSNQDHETSKAILLERYAIDHDAMKRFILDITKRN